MFFQRHGDSWAFAKPYGYSVWLAPFLLAFGTVHGIGVGNALLFLVLAAVCAAILLLRYRGAVVPLTLAAFLFGSVAMFGVFNVTTDLFEALLVACCLLCALVALGVGARGTARARTIGAALAMAFGAFLVAEKAPMVVLVGPLLLLLLMRSSSWRKRLVLVAVGAVVLGLAIAPYLWYSNGRSPTPYGGERYYTKAPVPFDGSAAAPAPSAAGWHRAGTDETVSAGYAVHHLVTAPAAKAQALGWYFAGRHTGLLMTMPLAVAVFILVLARWKSLSAIPVVLAVGVVLYIGFYVVLFSDNYYGGGTSFGNRYFLQASPIVLALAVSASIPLVQMTVGAVVSLVVGVAMLWPHYFAPRRVLSQLGVISTVQQVLPNETSLPLPAVAEFRCPGAGCFPPLRRPP